MLKRKSILVTLSLAIMFCFSLVLGLSVSNASVVYAASAPSAVTVNAQNLYSGYYLESNDSTTYSTGATTEPASYVAWYDGVTLTLNGYNSGQITFGGAKAVDLTIKLKGENTITASREGIASEECNNLIIDADSEATLNINITSSTETVYGIGIGYGATTTTGTVTIKGKATVNIKTETSVNYAYGIHAKTGFNIVGSANLSIKNTSSYSTSDMSYSIASFNNQPVFNTDGVVTLDNSECAMRNYCIGAYGIDMRKGTLICRYKPGSINSYACSQTIKTAPEGCVLREDPYELGETIIKYGEGHTVTVENGTDYYGKDSNQYVAGETVYVKAGIEGLDFDKWEGTGITFANPTQKETSFVMGNEDVTIKAVYNVFAKQPVFKRLKNTQGSISVQLNKQVSNTSEVVLLKSTGEVDVNVSFSLDSASDNYTYTCSSVWANYTPAGTYKIRVKYGSDYFYSDTFEIDYTDKTPSASVSDVIVNGKTGREITPVSFDVTLSYATFKAIAEGTNVSSWFRYLPNGLVVKISAVSEGATGATITISGTPTESMSRYIELNIPKEVLATGNDNIITTKATNEAKFNIFYPTSYNITMTDGKAQVGGETKTKINEGSMVTIIANDKDGYVFDKWVVVSGGVTLVDENNKETTFVMPESNVEIKATYKTIVSSIEAFVTKPIKDNTADTTSMRVNDTVYSATNVEWYKGEGVVSSMQMGATDKFIAGQKYTVVVTIKLNSGYVFAGDSSLTKSINGQTATLNSGAGTDTITIKTTFTVAADPIPEHSVTVENGKLTGGATTGTFAEGASVTVTANDPATDMMFDKWTVSGVTLSSEQLSSQTVTFTMGTSDVTITATYKAIPKYTVTITDGKLADNTTTGSFKEGESITITADTKEGFTFNKWTATGITLTSEQLSSQTITIIVGTNNITLTATYTEIVVPTPKHNVTIENGTNTGGEEIEVGQTVTITAGVAPAGKVFDKWVVESGSVTLANENSETTTFVMPNGEVKIRATYKDITPSGEDDTPTVTEKKGLPGGAIAGIVIGSVLVVSLGGFAIFWFAIRKKSFAELMEAIKSIFKKKTPKK